MHEIVFEVLEEADGGFVASAMGETIVTQGDTLDEVRHNVREAVLCHFEGGPAPQVIRLHFVRQEVLAV